VNRKDDSNSAALACIAQDLIENARATDFCGFDPFDGLNSRLFRNSGLQRLPFASIAWLQFHKRSPINFRGIVGVKRERNPKGVALFILGLLSMHERTGEGACLETATELGDWLLDTAVDRKSWTHFAWGYHFDWAARAFFVPRGKPNAITTCYVARALYALGNVTACARYTEAAIDAGRFLGKLYQSTGEGRYFAYIPGETAFVHNASLWSAALVAKTGRISGDTQLMHRALAAARQTVSMQASDGSWLYGTRPHHGFIDGFHTGYNLEALSLLQESLETQEFQSAIDHGMAYYRRMFFLPDGTVKYFDRSKWPLDTHSFAEAILTLTNVGRTADDIALAGLVVERMIADLYLPKAKRFIYQKGKNFTNKINYLRWTQAWAFYALSSYMQTMSTESGVKNGTL
jgi:hypothetical protein